MNSRRWSLIVIFAVIFIIGGYAVYQYNEALQHQQKQINIKKQQAPMPSIQVETKQTRIKLQPSNGNQVQAHLSGRLPKRDQMQLVMKREGKQLSIQVKTKLGRQPLWGETLSNTQLVISLPERLYHSVSLRSDQGRIQVDPGLQAVGIHVQTSSGQTQLGAVQTGALKIATQDGEFSLSQMESTPAGKRTTIEQVQMAGDRVTLNGVNGVEQDLKVEADSNLAVQLTKLNLATLNTYMQNGSIAITDFQGNSLRGDLHAANTTLQNIQANLILTTDQGNVIFDQRQGLGVSNEIDTEQGKVTVKLPAKVDAFVSLRTRMGKIHNVFPIKKDPRSSQEPGDQSLIGVIGQDRDLIPSLLVATQDGAIEIVR